MKRVKKIMGIYLLFGIIMVVSVSVSGSFALLTNMGGLSVFQYILYVGILGGLCWLPYSIAIISSPYAEYFVFSDTPIILILYMLFFVILSLCSILKTNKAV